MSGPAPDPDVGGERGETLVMALVLLTATLFGITALVSASEQWEARRQAAAAAATMARSAAQGDPVQLRRGADGIDAASAQLRAEQVLAALNGDGTDYTGRITRIDGWTVATEATTTVHYTFPLPGFPDQVTGSASAEAVQGGGP